MEAESFFSRWSRRKSEVKKEETAPDPDKAQAANPAAETPPAELPLPTMEDVARLTPESDFTPFVARGVDESIRRSALKKLFADPHFNVMDGLDTYIEDYNKFEPIPPEMLAALNHAKSLLNPLGQLDKSVMAMLETDKSQDAPPEQATADETLTAPEEPAIEEAPATTSPVPPAAGDSTAVARPDGQPSSPHTDPPCASHAGAQAPHHTLPPSAEASHDPIQSL
jgi:hypothetical protein